MTADVEALFAEIVRERGGIDAMPITTQALCRALAQALASEPINPSVVSQLTALLPPVIGAARGGAGGFLDPNLLTDGELEFVCGIYSRLEAAGLSPNAEPEPSSPEARERELLDMIAKWQDLHARAEDRARVAEQAEEQWRTMHGTALFENRRLQERVSALEAAQYSSPSP